MNALGFTLDALLVAWLAWLRVRMVARDGSGLEKALAWGLTALLLIAGAGVLLGVFRGLGLAGFLAKHGAFAVLVHVLRRRQQPEDFAAARQFPRELWQDLAATPAERAAALGLAVVAVAFLVLASTAQPVVFDALTYRLSRVGHWLQEGRIGAIATDDARLNYMPVAPDLIMAWLMTATTAGFPLVAVAQTLGGLLALGATAGLARLTGLGRLPALGAAALLLGLPNVAPQFTSAYTDLFKAGVLAAGYVLWLSALRRGRGSWLGGAAAGLALGAKGTVVYFAPGLVLATAWFRLAPPRPPRRLGVDVRGGRGGVRALRAADPRAQPAGLRRHFRAARICGVAPGRDAGSARVGGETAAQPGVGLRAAG